MQLRIIFPNISKESILSHLMLMQQNRVLSIIGEGSLDRFAGKVGLQESEAKGVEKVTAKVTDGVTARGLGGNELHFVDIQSDPEVFKRLEDFVCKETGSVGRIEVLRLQVASASVTDTDSTGDKYISTFSSESNAIRGTVAMSTIEEEAENVVDTEQSGSRPLPALPADDESEDVLEIARRNRKQKKKRKNRIISELEALELEEESGISADNPDRSTLGSDEDTAELSEISRETSRSSTSLTVHAESFLPDGRPKGYKGKGDVKNKQEGGNFGGNKKGKKAKRREKEEEIERKLESEKIRERIAAEGNNLLQSSGGTEILAKDSIVSSSSFRSLLSPALPSFEGDLQINSSTAPILPVEAEGVIKAPPLVPESMRSCNTCGGSFTNSITFRAHFKSEWHRYNLKLKLKKLPTVTEQEFLELALNVTTKEL